MSGKKRQPTPASSKAAGKPTGEQTAGSAGKTAAQKRLAAQRAMAAASGARKAKRRQQLYRVWVPVAVVVIVLVAFGIVKLASSDNSSSHPTSVAASDVVTAVTSVPPSVLDAVGAGSGIKAPAALSGAALTADGKPRVLYVGAEWCPFCAAERWPLAVALSRFGTLSGLGQTRSSPDDVDANTATLSFHGASYTSSYISLTAREIEDGSRNQLDTLDAADEALFTGTGKGSFPFIDIGGKYLISGSSYDPGILGGKGKDWSQIAAALSDPSSSIGKAVDGAANMITAAICNITTAKPANVCNSAGVLAAAKRLP